MLRHYVIYTFVFLLAALDIWCQESISISGTVNLDSNWAPMVYVSKIRGLNDMYMSAEHLIIAQTEVDQHGRFKVIVNPEYDGDQLIRLHISQRGDPAATLIIDGIRENHGFYAINTRTNLVVKTDTFNQRLFNHFHASGHLNDQLLKIDRLIQRRETENSEVDSDTREKVTGQLIDELYHFSDTSSSILPAWYALIKSDYGFNRDMYLSKMVSLRERLGGHPYLNPFISTKPKAGINTALIILSILIFLSGVLGFFWLSQKKLKQKIYQLSPQERKVATLLIAGKSNKEIASELHVEVSTVKSHIYKLFNKLDINSRNEVLQYRSYFNY